MTYREMVRLIVLRDRGRMSSRQLLDAVRGNSSGRFAAALATVVAGHLAVVGTAVGLARFVSRHAPPEIGLPILALLAGGVIVYMALMMMGDG
jgi:hypothetical protein